MFVVYNSFFIALGILGNSLTEIIIEKSLIFSGTYETSLDTSPPPKSLSLHCKQISSVENEVDVQPTSLLAYMQVSAGKAAFNPKYLVSRKLDTHFWQLDFKLLYEKSNVINCVKSVQIWSFFWSIFSCIRTEYGDLNLRILFEYRKIRTRKNSVFRHFSRSDHTKDFLSLDYEYLQ